MSSDFLGGGRNRAWRYRGFLVRVSGEQDRGFIGREGRRIGFIGSGGIEILGICVFVSGGLGSCDSCRLRIHRK